MNDINSFLREYKTPTLLLVERFNIANNTKWSINDFWQELIVQLGHLMLLHQENDMRELMVEPFRTLRSVGDEYADVLLQSFSLLLYISNGDDLYLSEDSIVDMGNCVQFSQLYILASQIGDCLLRMSHKKEPIMDSIEDMRFLRKRVMQIIYHLFQISKLHSVDLINEYDSMLLDANQHLDRKSNALSSSSNNQFDA